MRRWLRITVIWRPGYFRDARGGLFQPPQDDLALGMIGRAALEQERARER